MGRVQPHVPRYESRKALRRDRFLDSRRPRPRAPTRGARRRRRREFHPAGDAERGTRLRRAGSAPPRSGHAAHAGIRERRSVARPQRLRADDGAGVGDRVAHRHRGDRTARSVHRGPDRRHPRRDRGAGHARAPSSRRRRTTDRDADGRSRAQRGRGADRHVVCLRSAARTPRQSRPAGLTAGRVCVSRRGAVGCHVDPHRRPLALAVLGTGGSAVGARRRPHDTGGSPCSP